MDGMQQRSHYSRAPITEAVIDLRVELLPEATLAEFSNMYDCIEANYPKCENLLVFEGQMMVGASVGATAIQTQIGYTYSSADGKQIVQARRDGFAFSRLAPYENWETFQAEAKRLWATYQSVIHPKLVNRLAVRYVNRLDLPLPLHDLKEYLQTVPEVAPGPFQALSGYFMQLQIPQPDIAASLVLNQAIIPPPTPDVVAILLDLDLFQDISSPRDETFIWYALEQLHTRLDEVFESCITDNTRELIR